MIDANKIKMRGSLIFTEGARDYLRRVGSAAALGWKTAPDIKAPAWFRRTRKSCKQRERSGGMIAPRVGVVGQRLLFALVTASPPVGGADAEARRL